MIALPGGALAVADERNSMGAWLLLAAATMALTGDSDPGTDGHQAIARAVDAGK